MGSPDVVAPAALGSFFLLASYLNLNDPDWILWSTAYALGAAVCGWSALQGAGTSGTGTAAESPAKGDASWTRRSVAMAYGAACLGLAGHSAFLAPRGEPVEAGDDGIIVTFLSSEVAREAGGALIMAQAMALCAFVWRPSEARGTATTSSSGGAAVGVVSVAVAIVGVVLGVFLPGYLQRAGIAVPAHCGGE
ncbi:unnamed protein product [Hapterophycus canaliculatus]